MAEHRQPLARIELLQGTLDLIILQTLRWGPRHGYGLAQMIRATSQDALFKKILNDVPDPLNDPLGPIALKAMAKDPARRYRDASAMAEALGKIS